MLDTRNAEGVLAKARAHAEANGLANALQVKLDYLDSYAGRDRTRCQLFPDLAPLSFEFTMEKLGSDGEWTYWFNGGLIFHGNHDGYGSGAAPTFAVTVEAVSGWSVHT